MRKKEELIFIIGADGSGKDKLAQMLAKENKGIVVKLTEYDKGSPVFNWFGKKANKLIERGEKKKSNKLAVLGYGIHGILFGPYSFKMRHKAAKEGKPIIFNRYPHFDIMALASVYGKGKADELIKKGVKVLSAYKRPKKGDALYFLEVDADEAMRRIAQRGKPRQIHETKENIAKMNEVFSDKLLKLKRKASKFIERGCRATIGI